MVIAQPVGIMNNPFSQCAQNNPISKFLCKAFGGTPNSEGGGGSGSSGSSGGNSLFDLFENPISLEGGLRHLLLRFAEVLVGGLLVVVGLNALIKAQTNVNVVGTTTKLAKNTVKAAVK